MHIRTFEAANLQEALAEIRSQMGPDAAVLHTRDVGNRILGIWERPRVQVTAGLKQEDASASVGSAKGKSPGKRKSAEIDRLSQQIVQLSDQISELQQSIHPQASESQRAVERMLELQDWTAQEIERVTGMLQLDRISALDAIGVAAQQLADRVKIAGPISVPADGQRVVALVGPTGVGKTTTIAKLAAGFRLQEQASVGLITIDTYRTAAIEQLKTYAEAMRLPMEVVANGDQMCEAMQALSEVDLILIDTIGRSPLDREQIETTNKLLFYAQPDETHLVLSATSSGRVIRSSASCFSGLAPTAVILSKVDEVGQEPDLLWFCGDDALPLSYVTTGQKVPDDIELATPE